MRELVDSFGGAIRYQKTYRGNTKCCYDVSGEPAACFLRAISPFVRLKAEQVILGIAWQSQRRPRQRDAHGRVMSRDNAVINLDRQACELMKLLKTASIAAVSTTRPEMAVLVDLLLHPDVLAHHAKSIRVLHTLTPLGVAMAGEDIVDPFKD